MSELNEGAMTLEMAQRIVSGSVRNFSKWLGNLGYPKPEVPAEKDVKFLQECFPRVKKNDPSAWDKGGWKRVELDEALAFLHLPPLED